MFCQFCFFVAVCLFVCEFYWHNLKIGHLFHIFFPIGESIEICQSIPINLTGYIKISSISYEQTTDRTQSVKNWEKFGKKYYSIMSIVVLKTLNAFQAILKNFIFYNPAFTLFIFVTVCCALVYQMHMPTKVNFVCVCVVLSFCNWLIHKFNKKKHTHIYYTKKKRV